MPQQPQAQQHVVAVAGGTGGVGKTIIQQLQLHRERFKVVVFTRSEPKVSVDDKGTEYVRVDYSDANIDGLASLLREHQVKTVISTIIISEQTCGAQMNLIRAAVKANDVTKRFIPSEFGFVNVKEIVSMDPSVQYWIDAAELLASSPLQYTRIATGFFVDYLGMPYVETNMDPFTWVMDIYGRRAAIPGDGEQLISLTHTVDLARYVVKLLEIAEDGGQWDEWSIVVGEDISFNEVLKLAERVRGGEQKFQVTHDTIEDLESGNATIFPLPGETEIDPTYLDGQVKDLCAFWARLYHHGVLHMPSENRLTDRFRNEIRPLGVEEFLAEAWKGKS